MALPFFYMPGIVKGVNVLDEETSKHVVQVLRMNPGESILLTDGAGLKAEAIITGNNRKRCEVEIVSETTAAAKDPSVTIAISLLKNKSRFEWFLEKATEIGVARIVPLLCERTVKESFRHDRMNAIIISAMLQSQQAWLPELTEPQNFSSFLAQQPAAAKKYIAHCMEGSKISKKELAAVNVTSVQMLIGPEGDFSPAETDSALNAGYEAVSLGATRLRTESAGMVAAVLLCR